MGLQFMQETREMEVCSVFGSVKMLVGILCTNMCVTNQCDFGGVLPYTDLHLSTFSLGF